MSYKTDEIALKLRELGPVIDVAATKALYASQLEMQPREGVCIFRDLTYGPDQRHRLDVYRLKQNTHQRLPIIVFFHGGGFVAGDKAQRENVGLFFARNGFCVVIPNYRLAPGHQWPAGAEDVATVLTWTQNHGEEFGGDTNHSVLVGESAGAAHVAAATLTSLFLPDVAKKISGAVFISGLYDVVLDDIAKRQFGLFDNDPANEAYFGKNRENWRAKSTIDLISAAPFPLLISYAELDPVQMQVQAGALFSHLARHTKFSPDITVISGHSHLSQIYSINTGDLTLTDKIKFFSENVIGSTPPSFPGKV